MPESPVRLTVVDQAGAIVAAGEVDASTATSLSDAISARLVGGSVVLDIAGVTFMDSSGLRVLIESHQSAAALTHRFTVRHPTPAIAKLIAITGLDRSLEIVA